MHPYHPFRNHLDRNQQSHHDKVDKLNLEPTPIGPSGIDVVDRISLETSPLVREKDVDATIKCLGPLIANLQMLPLQNEEGMDGATSAGLSSASHKQNRSERAPYELADATTTTTYEEEYVVILNDLTTSAHSLPSSIRPERRISSTEISFDDLSIASSTNSRADSVVALRQSQTDKWNQRYQELVEFRERHGHCLVPLNFPENPTLAHWIKRQRYQYSQKYERKRSTMTDERESTLEKLGFIWDSHAASWEDRYDELLAFKDIFGHCNVPSLYPQNPKLSIWVKCQRRQFKLYSSGKRSSNISRERICKLLHLGFVFDPRGTMGQRSPSSTSL